MKKECPECKGTGYFVLSKERILADPRHTSIECPKCNGTGKIMVGHPKNGGGKGGDK